MSCLGFEVLLVGQVLLDESTCSGAHKRSAHTRPSPAQPHSISSRRQQSRDSLCFYSSFLAALQTDLGFIEKDRGTTASSPRSPAACGTLYSIPEEDEGEAEEEEVTDDDEEEERLYAMEGPLLRLFKSCFAQFAYLMAMDKTPKSSAPMYKTPKSLV